MDIITRMKQYMDYRQLTSSQFADAAGIPRPTLSQLLNGRNKSNEGAKKVSSLIIDKIHEAFPTLNVMWLLFGDGDMELNSNFEISEPKNDFLQEVNDFQNTANQDIQRQIVFDDDVREYVSEKFPSDYSAVSPVKNAPSSFQEKQNATRPPSSDIPQMTLKPDKSKKVQSIMVFYDDNSFEIFKPA